MKTKLKRVKLAKEPVLKLPNRWIVQDANGYTKGCLTKREAYSQVMVLVRNNPEIHVNVFKATYNFVEAWVAE